MSNGSKRLLVLGGLAAVMILTSSAAVASSSHETMQVSGNGVHFFTDAIVHSQEATPTGMIQRSTDIVKLTGDISGYVLYHPTSEFDFVNNTMSNTGTQFFSGTIAGSDPVILHDDEFRFDVDLSTGAEIGEVHFSRSNDAPDKGRWWECDLVVVGTGLTSDGDATFDYSGRCTRAGA
jgi:hypothetical protein